MSTTMKETKTKSHKTDKRGKLIQDMSQKPSLGDIVVWALPDNRGIKNAHRDVVEALKKSSLDEKVAKEFQPAQAFNRACSKLKEERVIDVLRNDKDEILFQFSKRQVKDDILDGGQEFLYAKEVKILLDKGTGTLTCKDAAVLEQAKKELDRCMEARTTTDVSQMVNKLFEAEADLIPFGTGVYFVPKMYSSFTDKIANFMTLLGRKLRRVSLPEGGGNDGQIQDVVESHLTNLADEMESAIKDFSGITRDSTIEATAARINNSRAKLEAYKTYLGDVIEEKINERLEYLNGLLMASIEKVTEERKALPPRAEGGSMRQRVAACLNSTPKTVSELCEEAGTNTNGIKMYLDGLVNDGKISKVKDGYCLVGSQSI